MSTVSSLTLSIQCPGNSRPGGLLFQGQARRGGVSWKPQAQKMKSSRAPWVEGEGPRGEMRDEVGQEAERTRVEQKKESAWGPR